jgi:autotransporter-associated beta strand protein
MNHHTLLTACLTATLAVAALDTRGADGVWTNLNGGSWPTAANWLGGTVPGGAGDTADFSQGTLTAATAVTLDGGRTVGNLLFGDVGNTYGWLLTTGSSGPLTLAVGSGSPLITVNGQTTTIGTVLAGTQGLTKAGAGTLALTNVNTYLGGTVINQGVVSILTTNGSLGAGNTNSVVINGGTIAAKFTPATVAVLWPVNIGVNGGEIDLLQTGNNGRWLFAANTLSGSGTLTLKPGATRFTINDQSVSGFSGKWIIDGSGRVPSATSGFINLNVLAGDNCFGAAPAVFTPDAVTLINDGVLVNLNAANPTVGSPTRGITIGSGGGQFFVGGANNFSVNSQISGTTGDPLYFTANNNNAGVQLNQVNTYNGNSVIHNVNTGSSRTWLRMGMNNPLPHGPGKGLVAFSSSAAAGLAVLDLAGWDATINGFGANGGSSVVDNLVGAGTSASTGSSFTNTLFVGSGDTSSSFAGIIRNTTNTLNLAKIGTGTLTLTGTNTYLGSTTVSAGQLVLATATPKSPGDYSVADGATLALNIAAASPTLPMSALTLGNSTGASLALNFSSNPSSSVPPVTATELTAVAVMLNLNFGAGVTVGQYPLIQYGAGGIGGAGLTGFTLVTSPSAMTAYLTNNADSSSIDVVVTVAPSINVTLASSANPCARGQAVVFTASATVAGSPASGTVTFKNGAASMGTATLNGVGVATFTTNFATLGTYSITASYGGSTSLSVEQSVVPGLDVWTGASSGLWDILTTTNWQAVGVPAKYYDGDAVQFDDSATGSAAISLGVTVNPLSVVVSNQSKAYSLSGAGSISGAASLLKTGTGTLTINNTNAYTGNTVVSNGVLTYAGGGTYTGQGAPGGLFVGGGGGNGILHMNSSGAISFGRFAALGGLTGGATDAGNGAIYQTAGAININTLSGGVGFTAYPLEIGAGGPGAYGYYQLSGGALNTLPLVSAEAQSVRVGSGGLGAFLQSGGTLNDVGYFDLASSSVSGGEGGRGVATFAAGSATIGNAIRVGVQANGEGILNLGTLAGGTATVAGSSVSLLAGSTATNAVLNLNAGILQLSGSLSKNANNGVGTATLNLNGGTLRATGNNQNLIDASLYNVTVFNGGLNIETVGSSATVGAGLSAAYGSGIYPAGGTLAVPGNGGAGYIGAPLVTVTGGSGSGALAIAAVSGGAVTGVTFTCPGVSYSAGDTLTFVFAGGGATTPASDFSYTLQSTDLVPNSTGGLTKSGSGTLVLNGFNSYTGSTVVSNGTLRGSGFIAGPVSVRDSGTLASGEAATLGQFSLSSTLLLAGNVSLRIDKTGGFAASDLVQGMTQVTYGGTLSVTNVTSDGSPLALNDKFTLFTSSGGFTGSFGVVNLPTLPVGLAWDISKLPVDGSIAVEAQSVATNPTNITVTASSGSLTLSWPADHTGWRLEAQTNSLSVGVSHNWTTVPGSTTTNSMIFPINTAEGSVFFRLVYP